MVEFGTTKLKLASSLMIQITIEGCWCNAQAHSAVADTKQEAKICKRKEILKSNKHKEKTFNNIFFLIECLYLQIHA